MTTIRVPMPASVIAAAAAAAAAATVASNIFYTGGNEPYIFQISDIESAFPVAGARKTAAKIGSMYISNSTATFTTSAGLLNQAAGKSRIGSYEYTLVDMGKSIQIGIQNKASDIIVLQYVKRTGTVESGGEPVNTPATGYVVISNKVSITFHDALKPAVCRN